MNIQFVCIFEFMNNYVQYINNDQKEGEKVREDRRVGGRKSERERRERERRECVREGDSP